MRIKTVVLACMKGGSGKTTISTNLGVTLERMGRGPVAFMDLDPSEALSKWWNRREATMPAFAKPDSYTLLAEKIQQLDRDGFNWCVIDTPPRRGEVNAAAIAVADFVVIPIMPGPFDVDDAGTTVRMCQEADKPFVFVLNRTTPRALLTANVTIALSAWGQIAPTNIGHRQGYPTAAIDGRTIAELRGRSDGAEEQAKLAGFLMDKLGVGDPKKEKAHV